MDILKQVFQHCRHPRGFLGRFMVRGMNRAHRRIWQWALEEVAVPPQAFILDVGCGGGGALRDMLRRFPQARAMGVDCAEDSLRVTRETVRPFGRRCAVRRGMADALPCESDAIDLITAFETIYFWEDRPAALKECMRALKPGGLLVIACEVSDPDSQWVKIIDGMAICLPEELAEEAECAGFDVTQINKTEKAFYLYAKKPLTMV